MCLYPTFSVSEQKIVFSIPIVFINRVTPKIEHRFKDERMNMKISVAKLCIIMLDHVLMKNLHTA